MTKLLTSSQNFTHKKETMIYPFPVILFCLSVCLFVNSFLLGKQWSGSLNKQEFWIFCWHKLILCLVSLSCQLTKLGISIIHSFLPHNAKRGKYCLLLYFESHQAWIAESIFLLVKKTILYTSHLFLLSEPVLD